MTPSASDDGPGAELAAKHNHSLPGTCSARCPAFAEISASLRAPENSLSSKREAVLDPTVQKPLCPNCGADLTEEGAVKLQVSEYYSLALQGAEVSVVDAADFVEDRSGPVQCVRCNQALEHRGWSW